MDCKENNLYFRVNSVQHNRTWTERALFKEEILFKRKEKKERKQKFVSN